MAAPGHRLDDQRVEQWIGNLLRAGVLTAAAVVFVGAILFLEQHGGEPADYSKFRGEPSDLRIVGDIVAGALTMDGREVIQLGILLLIATPVARVILAAGAFALERDRLYVVLTLVVLGVLLASLTGLRF